MKKLIFLILIALAPATLSAAELCASWKKIIEPDMQMPESLFSKKNAESSEEFLRKVKSKEVTKYGWYEPGNAKKIIEGYRLKKKAIESLKSSNKIKTPELESYCDFIVKDAFYYD